VQSGVKLLAATADGIDVQAGDLGQQGVSAVAGLLELQGGQPAALLFIEAAQEEVDLVVVLAFRVLLPTAAGGAFAQVNPMIGHDTSSMMSRLKPRRTLYRKPWKSFLDGPLSGRLNS
jgi:hypothetical protein